MSIKKLLCCGDSITYGYGVPPGTSWYELLAKKVDFPMVNAGANGARLLDLLPKMQREIRLHQPSHVLIFAGINDLIQQYPARLLIKEIDKLLREAERLGATPIFATAIMPKAHIQRTAWIYENQYDAIKKEVSSFNGFLRDFSLQNNFLLLDFDHFFQEVDPRPQLFPDGIHPNKEAHKLMAELILKQLS